MGVLTVVVVKIKLIGQERWKVPASSRRVRNEGANKWEVLARWKSRAGLLWAMVNRHPSFQCNTHIVVAWREKRSLER
jgi:hypothetical protein